VRLLKNKRFVSRLVKAAVLTGMDYLPIILKKGQPFLEALSSGESGERAVCPRGRVFALLDEQGHLRLYLLSERGQQQKKQVIIDSKQFTG